MPLAKAFVLDLCRREADGENFSGFTPGEIEMLDRIEEESKRQ
jgi:hypothetical protein